MSCRFRITSEKSLDEGVGSGTPFVGILFIRYIRVIEGGLRSHVDVGLDPDYEAKVVGGGNSGKRIGNLRNRGGEER